MARPTLPAIGPRTRRRALTALVVVALLAAATVLLVREPDRKTVTAHLSRAVSIYVGTEVRILGVPVGEVTAVVPEGESVRVEMAYDAEYDVPADAQAVVVTPTLVADRFVQLTPVHTGGPVLPDGATIALPDTGVPVELDRIYASLQTLSDALGPEGANRDGSLDRLLSAGAEALDGQGAVANQALRDVSLLADTLGSTGDELFSTVEQLDAFTRTLAANDRVVDAFVQDLARASAQLAGEREEIGAALDALAGAVGTVRTFVRDNRDLLTGEVEDLVVVLRQLVAERDSLATALEKGPLGAGNLALGFDTKTGSQNARIQIGPNVEDLDGFLCAVVTNAGIPQAGAVCDLFEQLLEPLGLGFPDLGARATASSAQLPALERPASSLLQLLGGRR